MNHSSPYLNANEAARKLGVSSKALRLYEERGLLSPVRSAAGWRAYGGETMVRAGEIAALRKLGLSLADVARVLDGDAATLDLALAAHQASTEARIGELTATLALLRDLRARLGRGELPEPGQVARSLADASAIGVEFDLPWPWGGEHFELPRLARVTYLVGALGSGKTRLARMLADTLPGALFSGLDRVAGAANSQVAVLDATEALVDRLVDDGAIRSDALRALAVVMNQSQEQIVVVDLIEQGLDAETQEVVGDLVRQRTDGLPPLMVMTRSTAILDLGALGKDAALLYCPANHSPPHLVACYPGASGYEALQSCLGAPEVRARTEGMRVAVA